MKKRNLAWKRKEKIASIWRKLQAVQFEESFIVEITSGLDWVSYTKLLIGASPFVLSHENIHFAWYGHQASSHSNPGHSLHHRRSFWERFSPLDHHRLSLIVTVTPRRVLWKPTAHSTVSKRCVWASIPASHHHVHMRIIKNNPIFTIHSAL